MNKFVVSVIECYEEDEVLTIALGDDAFDPENYLLIARLDDEDNAQVGEGIGFQTAQSEYEVANAIEAVFLHENGLEVIVKQAFVTHYGGRRFFAEIPCEDEHLQSKLPLLRQYLSALFDGSNVSLVM